MLYQFHQNVLKVRIVYKVLYYDNKIAYLPVHSIGDLKVSDAISQGVQKHWDRVRGQRHFHIISI